MLSRFGVCGLGFGVHGRTDSATCTRGRAIKRRARDEARRRGEHHMCGTVGVRVQECSSTKDMAHSVLEMMASFVPPLFYFMLFFPILFSSIFLFYIFFMTNAVKV